MHSYVRLSTTYQSETPDACLLLRSVRRSGGWQAVGVS